MTTTVGLLHLEFHIPGSRSLKDKRRSVKGFKDRMIHHCNVSVAEVGSLDDRQRSVIAVAMVGKDTSHLQSALQKIVNVAAEDREMILAHHEIEWL